MSPPAVLEVSGLGKAYRHYGGEYRRLLSWLGWPVRGVTAHWTLRDVGFTVAPGEAVGIVGQNGAGKSTLLKIITGTMRPTEGRVAHHGRVAAILELGMGFHPDLTGRQNAFHAAGLMGYTREQVNAAMDWIEAFAEIGEYFDAPVRTYSSGMQMRVAFAVATAHRPDLLIVDEALSVGDSYFQHKSFDRIRTMCQQGTSLLLVSHDRSAIQAVCHRAILLDRGRVLRDGEPEAVMDYYNALIAQRGHSRLELETTAEGKVRTRSGTGEATFTAIELLDAADRPVECVAVGEPVTLRIRVAVHAPLATLVLGYGLKDRLGQVLYGTNTWHTGQVIRDTRPGDRHEFRIRFPATLGPGSYSVHVALHDADTHLSANYEWRELALVFDVLNRDRTPFVGSLWIEPQIAIGPDTGPLSPSERP